MNQKNITIRVIYLVASIFIIAFGVALTIFAGIGTTPFASIAYVLSTATPAFSVGALSVIVNLVFIVLQLFLSKRPLRNTLLQIPLALLFGVFLDLSLGILQQPLPDHYFILMAICIAGCFVLAFGIFLFFKANISVFPSEGLGISLAEALNIDFGRTKICLDSLLIIIALIISIVLLGKIVGIREGTFISALSVGFIVQFLRKRVSRLEESRTHTEQLESYEPEPYLTTKNFVITISREYGSGGHAVGELIAKRLGVGFYDSKLIDMTAEASGFTPEYVKENEQKLSNGLLYKLYKQNYAFVNDVVPPRDALFMVQTDVIRKIAAKESCVIVGRCADYVLKGHPNCFKVFIHANTAFRLNRVINDYGIDPSEAEKEMERVDKERNNYMKYFTGRQWEDLKYYDFSIDSSLFGFDITFAMIIDAFKKSIYTRES